MGPVGTVIIDFICSLSELRIKVNKAATLNVWSCAVVLRPSFRLVDGKCWAC